MGNTESYTLLKSDTSKYCGTIKNFGCKRCMIGGLYFLATASAADYLISSEAGALAGSLQPVMEAASYIGTVEVPFPAKFWDKEEIPQHRPC